MVNSRCFLYLFKLLQRLLNCWCWDLDLGNDDSTGAPGYIAWIVLVILAPVSIYSFFDTWIKHFSGKHPYR